MSNESANSGYPRDDAHGAPGQDPYGYPGGQGDHSGYPQGQPEYGQSQYGQSQYGQAPYGQAPGNYGAPPDNGLVWGILVTVLCCLPLGIVSIVKASNVNSLWAMGQYAAAHEAAAEARRWAKIGAIVGGVFYALIVVFYVVMFVFLFAATASSGYATY
ncbi:CD225/dispanin family protein [Hoyosella sp. G463]|uniref:CD225/dispanin family protein n=1 Tax=Lolliginicoccus lacisalsi TaxID=2742202 RepID=A0A927JA38_9ACTN|nr:CD225/dispanin family protein [Lolliginicoccus lacisalsi]MBD8505363.1 CD225/dispanin family protein [Lolliginicoccus lacisalsi]